MRTRRFSILGLVIVLLGLSSILFARPQEKNTPPAKKTSHSEQGKSNSWPTDPSLHVGSDTCKICL